MFLGKRVKISLISFKSIRKYAWMHKGEVTGTWECLPYVDFSFYLCVSLAFKFWNHRNKTDETYTAIKPLCHLMVAKFHVWVSGILTLDVGRTSSENNWLESPQAVENLSFRTSIFLSRHHIYKGIWIYKFSCVWVRVKIHNIKIDKIVKR